MREVLEHCGSVAGALLTVLFGGVGVGSGIFPGLYGVDVEKSPKDLAPSTMDAAMGNPFFAMFLDDGTQVGNNQAPVKWSAVFSDITTPVQKPVWAVDEAPHFVSCGPAGNPPENTIWIGSGNGIDIT